MAGGFEETKILDWKMTEKIKKYSLLEIFILISLLFVQCAGITPRPVNQSGIPKVKVLLIPDTPQIWLSFKGNVQVRSSGKFLIKLLPKNSPLRILSSEGTGIVLKSSKSVFETKSDSIELRPEGAHPLSLQGRHYRGELLISVTKTGNICVHNALDLESYLKGVVPAEIGQGNRRIFEALKAQAVAARTYAFEKLGNTKSKGSSVLQATISDQVYGGADAESRWTSRAVEATAGEIVIFRGKPIHAFYSSTCGGRTEPGRDVWPQFYAPYLKGVADDFGEGAFCRESPDYRWLEFWSITDLDSILAKNLSARKMYRLNWGHVKDLKILSRFPSGRVKDLLIVFQYGKQVIHGNRIRWILTPTDRPVLRSTLFRLVLYRDKMGVQSVLAIGAGNGHGVGMCQWGAMGMAKAGFRYDQILKAYYRGVKLRRVY